MDILVLCDQAKKTARNWAKNQLPTIKNKVKPLKNFPDEIILDGLVNNWFELFDEKIKNRQEKFYLAQTASAIKKVEVSVYRKALKKVGKKQLNCWGIDEKQRNLLLGDTATPGLLEVAGRADSLFLRFLQASYFSPQLLDNQPAKQKSFAVINKLFPKESGDISLGLINISQQNCWFSEEQSSLLFQRYLKILSSFFSDLNYKKIVKKQKAIEKIYSQCLRSGFPIVLTPPLETSQFEPYLDPELRISFRDKKTKNQEKTFQTLKKNLSGIIKNKQIEQRDIFLVNPIVSFGVNLVFCGTAQEKPEIVLFLREQKESYDKALPTIVNKFMAAAINETTVEKMSLFLTIFHEIFHLTGENSPCLKNLIKKTSGKLGLRDALETEAEILYRSWLLKMSESKKLFGHKEQWAYAMTASSLQALKDLPENNSYFKAACYTLNELFAQKIVYLKDKQFYIKKENNYQDFSYAQNQLVKNYLLALKKNNFPSVSYLLANLKPNKQLCSAISFLKAS